jgi:Tol biopolymer transport system component/tRNA A-37 threonylcarbamoyl transferase component Bud32
MTYKQIAHFEITRKLGEGGMGVVYEAVDHHLDRRIALKILPAEKVASKARKQRFIQEAKAASALNHPNIVTIYDITTDDSVDYIAMELVAGQTLEELTANRRLKIQEALKYAVQIADALAAAHAAGIIHRDLKPANIMVTDRGLVKVLDFGLAKLADQTEVTEDDLTRTARALTEEGTVMGSAGYMSPEQAEGKKVDHRSDVFSFGLVLYEMLSGKRAFQGGTRMATMAAILNKEPASLPTLVKGLPKELERIVNRCLRKDLDRRFQSMAEVKIALEELKEETESGAALAVAPAAKVRSGRWRWIALGGGGALALAAGLALLLPRWREAPVEWKEVPLTSFQGTQADPALSPDGKQFAFAWDGGQEGAPLQVYVSLVGQGAPLRLTNPPATASYPTWSPDGQTIAFLRPGAEGGVFAIPALGGPERRLVGAAAVNWEPRLAHTYLRGGAWSPDGKWLYVPEAVGPMKRAIFAESVLGGEGHRLTDPPEGGRGDWSPAVSPDGRQLAFVRFSDVSGWNSEVFVCDLKDGQVAGPPRRLTYEHWVATYPTWTGDGQNIVYIAGDLNDSHGVYRVRASGGKSVRLAGIGEDAAALAIAPKGNRLVYTRSYRDYNLYKLQLPDGGSPAGPPVKFLSSTRLEEAPIFSPDGKRIAFSSNRTGVRQIWVADADGSNPVRLTNFAVGMAGSPRWSPDGQSIAFDARLEGNADVYTIPANGGASKRLTDDPAEDNVPCYSADGRWIYFASARSGTPMIYRAPANGGAAAQITHKSGTMPIASPDGKWIYYSRVDNSLWKTPADGGEETQVLPPRSLNMAFTFTVAASGIFYVGPSDPASHMVPVNLYRFADGKTVEVARMDRSPRLQISVSPDEKWLAFARLDSSVDELMMVENFR